MSGLLTDEQLAVIRNTQDSAGTTVRALLAHIDALAAQRDKAQAKDAVMVDAANDAHVELTNCTNLLQSVLANEYYDDELRLQIKDNDKSQERIDVAVSDDAAAKASAVLAAAEEWRNAMHTGNSGAITAAAGNLLDAIDAYRRAGVAS